MRILVVEDHRKIAQAIKKGLQQESFAVDVAYDGESGLLEALNEDYDAIILDIMLPGKSGLEVTKELRQSGKQTPVLLLTAKDAMSDKVKGLNSGADDYLTKPFAFEELLARLRALLRRPSAVLSAQLKCGNLTLDTGTNTVKRANKIIKLSAKEFALLEYLLRNQGQVLSKEKIRQHVWDFDADILPNTIEAYIGYLRTKIDKPFTSSKLIHTVHGFGYKMETSNE